MATLQINYKSGQSIKVTVDHFAICGTGRRFEWENMKPKPLLLGAGDIESVWEMS